MSENVVEASHRAVNLHTHCMVTHLEQRVTSIHGARMSAGKYKTIDLCAGIGGIRRGFELTSRFENVLSAEIDQFACRTYQHLFGDDPSHDLTSSVFKQLARETPYDVLLAGFPCQTFSSIGLKRGFLDVDKGIIFWHIVQILSDTRPKAVFLENVGNLVWHDKGKTFQAIITALEDFLGYRVVGVTRNDSGQLEWDDKSFIRNSKHFGIPQNRPRVYIVAFDSKQLNLDEVSWSKLALPTQGQRTIYRSLDELLEMGADPKYYLSSGLLNTLENHRKRNHENGNGFGCAVVNDPQRDEHIANTITATGGSGKERNMVIDIQETIPGMLHPRKHSPLNSKCIRYMTPREWGKLQGFINYAFMDDDGVDSFSFPEGVSENQQYQQFGNSVTIPVVETMADFIAEVLAKGSLHS